MAKAAPVKITPKAVLKSKIRDFIRSNAFKVPADATERKETEKPKVEGKEK